MSASGPELPPHLLAKRKRQLEGDATDDSVRGSGAKRQKSPSAATPVQRVLGPAPPPAPLSERPLSHPADSDSSSDSDDDFGPSLPGAAPTEAQPVHGPVRSTSEEQASQRTRRDEWMMVPPKQDDLAARMDPTKVRAKGFNTGKSARAPGAAGGDNAIWTETPEQKRKRLADEVMGVQSVPSAGKRDVKSERSRAKDEATAAKLREHAEKNRGSSLYDRHQKTHTVEKEDDPSKRAFDREKDMGAGLKIGNAQRKEMLNKAGDYSSKFAGGSYL